MRRFAQVRDCWLSRCECVRIADRSVDATSAALRDRGHVLHPSAVECQHQRLMKGMSYDSRKKLKVITVGNSFAITLPKQACRLLRIDRSTKMELSYNDHQLTLRPVARADSSDRIDKLQVARILRPLLLHFGLPQDVFKRISHDGTPLKTFLMDVDVGGHVDIVTLARLQVCLTRRREAERTDSSETWEETADAALIDVPNQATSTKVSLR